MKNSDYAFPDLTNSRGLTKRELFAALAMQGLLANHHNIDERQAPIQVAESSVKCAEALL